MCSNEEGVNAVGFGGELKISFDLPWKGEDFSWSGRITFILNDMENDEHSFLNEVES